MAKKDFLDELAKEVDAKKSGKIDHINNIDSFQSKHHHDEDVESIESKIEKLTEQAVDEARMEETIEQSIPSESPQPTVTPHYEDNSKPGGFQEEQFVPITNPKKKVSKGLIATVAVIAIAVVAFVIWSLMPHITMPQFVGKTMSDVSSWARQQQMETTAIAQSTPVYSLEYAEGVIIEQSVEEGKKIKTDTPITFTVSGGPDPDELIDFPDIQSMTLSELNDWISENKLSKTKVTTEYSTTVANGDVIAFELKNTDENNFKRNSTLNIRVSKGAAPAGQVTVQSFVGKTLAEAQSWASTNKLVFEKVETYSDSVEANLIISQSVNAGQAITQGSTFSVTVSKGKGVRIPNLVGYTKEQLAAWEASNDIVVIATEIYHNSTPGSVIAQKTPAGSVVARGDVVEITKSLYLPIIEETSRQWLGKDWMLLKSWVDEVNWKGADIQAGQYAEFQYNECSDTYPTPGMIIDYACWYGNTDEDQGCGRPLNLDSRIAYKISTGPCTVTPTATPILQTENLKSLEAIQSWCNTNGMSCTYEAYQASATDPTVWVSINNNEKYFTSNSTFQELVNRGTSIVVHYAQKTSEATPTPTATPTVVLTKANLASLADVQSWCNTNGMSCTYEVDNTITNIKVVYEGQTFTSEDNIQYMVNQGGTVQVYYKQDVVLPTTTPETPAG